MRFKMITQNTGIEHASHPSELSEALRILKLEWHRNYEWSIFDASDGSLVASWSPLYGARVEPGRHHITGERLTEEVR